MAKVMISLPDELLTRVDAAAAEESKTRSEYIRAALLTRLAEKPDLRRRVAAFAELRRRNEGIRLPGSPEELVRAERER